MSERSNAALHRMAHEAFAKGDMDTLSKMTSEDTVWHTPGKSPVSGEFRGREALFDEFFGKMDRLSNGTATFVKNIEYFGDDEHSVAMFRFKATRSGQTREFNVCEDILWNDGQILEERTYLDDQYGWDELWSGAESRERIMVAYTPEAVHEEWMQAFNSGNLAGLLSLYEPDSAVVSEPGGEVVSGLDALTENLQGYLSLEGRIDLRLRRCIRSTDLAILYSSWTMNGRAADGSEVHKKGETSDVVRRQADGAWLLAIDNPFGTEGIF